MSWGPPVDLGMGNHTWLTAHSGDISSVDKVISTAETSSAPRQIGSTVH